MNAKETIGIHYFLIGRESAGRSLTNHKAMLSKERDTIGDN